VRVISRKALLEFATRHKDAAEPLDNWYRRTSKAAWQNLADARLDYPHADLVGTCVVFNIAGNKYRLITRIFFRSKKVYIRSVLTHKDYNKGSWKSDCNSK
jgi:mRNA interferase HigB